MNISMHKSFPHLREIEITKLIENEPLLGDAVCDFGYKMLIAKDNHNMIINFLEEFLWTTLVKLWDTGNLSQSPAAKKHESNTLGGAVELAIKEKQLKSAQDIIKSLRNEIAKLTRLRQIERSQSLAVDSTNPDKLVPVLEQLREDITALDQPTDSIHTPEVVDDSESDFFVEMGTCTDPELLITKTFSDSAIMTESDPLLMECETLRLMVAQAQADLHASTESVSGGDSDERPLPSENGDYEQESPRVALIRTRAEVVFEHVLPSIAIVDESVGNSSPMVSTERSRLADLKTRELELMKEREIADELRIEELLREIVEKDEIIKTFHEELNRVGPVKSEQFITDSKNEETLTVHSVSGRIVEERLLEIHELRQENTRLTNLLYGLEGKYAGNNKLVVDEQVECDNDNMTALAFATEEIQTDNDLMKFVESGLLHAPQDRSQFTVSRMSAVVVTGSAGMTSHEKRLEEERDREAARAARAIEETRKVKIGLGELERQIAALQHQLRQSGVKQEHIESALASSGLVHLVQANRVGVFERLYQDALERMVKMEKIRERFKQIQQREYERKMRELERDTTPPEKPPKTSPVERAPVERARTLHSADGPKRTQQIKQPMQSLVRRHTSMGDSGSPTQHLVPERYLSAHSVLNEIMRK